MGGVDHSNINIKILNILSNYKKIKAHITTMSTNANIDELQNYAKDKKWVKLHINSSNIAKLMRKCDFAILTPSVTVHEARYMNLPFIAIKTVQNQQDMCIYLKEKNFLCLKQFDEQKLKNAISKMLSDIKQIGQEI
jgi:spore coat polysaccharide biosynthesis predicted glycosyltransferase SpsG